MTLSAVILTVSDRCAAGSAVDASGPALAGFVIDRLHAEIIATATVPDDTEAIRATLKGWLSLSHPPDLILSTNGTGLAPRDRTPEAVRPLLDIEHPGIMERARAICGARHPRAYISRGIAGVARSTLILNLPGSPKGAVETLDAVADLLPHAVRLIRGNDDPHTTPLHDPPHA